MTDEWYDQYSWEYNSCLLYILHIGRSMHVLIHIYMHIATWYWVFLCFVMSKGKCRHPFSGIVYLCFLCMYHLCYFLIIDLTFPYLMYVLMYLLHVLSFQLMPLPWSYNKKMLLYLFHVYTITVLVHTNNTTNANNIIKHIYLIF